MPISQYADFPDKDSVVFAEPGASDGRGVCTLRRCPSCGNCLTSDRNFCALFYCAAYDRVAHAAESKNPSATENKNPLGGRNRDKTGLRTVKKGAMLDYYGMTFVCTRVRKGVAYGETSIQKQSFFAPTNVVRVVV